MRYMIAETQEEAWIFVIQTYYIDDLGQVLDHGPFDLEDAKTPIMYKYFTTQNQMKNFIQGTKGYKHKRYTKAYRLAQKAFNWQEMKSFVIGN